MKRTQMQQIFRAVGRFSDVFLGHILPIQLLFYYQYFLYYDPYVGNYAPDPLTVAIGLFFLLPLFFTLVRISTVYDQPLREAFLAFLINRFQDKLMFWIRQKQFWIEAAAFSLLYLLASSRTAGGRVLLGPRRLGRKDGILYGLGSGIFFDFKRATAEEKILSKCENGLNASGTFAAASISRKRLIFRPPCAIINAGGDSTPGKECAVCTTVSPFATTRTRIAAPSPN